MTGLESQPSGIRSDWSANRTTMIAIIMNFLKNYFQSHAVTTHI